MAQYSIELDCPPGNPRPGDLLPGVLKDLGIELNPEKPQAMFFGCWTWLIPQDQASKYAEVQPQVKERITALYNSGAIRYGSW